MKFQTYSEIKSNVGHKHDVHAPHANLNGYPKVCTMEEPRYMMHFT